MHCMAPVTPRFLSPVSTDSAIKDSRLGPWPSPPPPFGVHTREKEEDDDDDDDDDDVTVVFLESRC